MTDWMPIESAPKDGGYYGGGPRILVSEDGYTEVGSWDGGRWTNDEGFTIEPTHWMPLPNPSEPPPQQ